MLASIKVALTAGSLAMGALWSFGGVPGNGHVKEETRQVGDFSGLELGGAMKATVKIGPKTEVKIEGDDNLLPLIKTEVKDGKLVARVERGQNLNPTKDIKLTIVTPNFTSVDASGAAEVTAEASQGSKFDADASGASHVTVTGVSAEHAEVDASGAAHITLSGTVKDAKIDASGAGSVKLDDLAAQEIKVDASGGAHVSARATAAASVGASGGATVRVKGNPQKREKDTSGGASISFE